MSLCWAVRKGKTKTKTKTNLRKMRSPPYDRHGKAFFRMQMRRKLPHLCVIVKMMITIRRRRISKMTLIMKRGCTECYQHSLSPDPRSVGPLEVLTWSYFLLRVIFSTSDFVSKKNSSKPVDKKSWPFWPWLTMILRVETSRHFHFLKTTFAFVAQDVLSRFC